MNISKSLIEILICILLHIVIIAYKNLLSVERIEYENNDFENLSSQLYQLAKINLSELACGHIIRYDKCS